MNRFSLATILLAAVALPATALHGQWCNPGATGECDEPNSTPGCRITECCDLVCEFDPVCCESVWDENCVLGFEDLCGGYTCPGLQSCDSTSSEAGCSDQTCCRLVCNHDSFCCWVEWDQYCIDVASALCDVDPCEIDIPEGTPQESEFCYERLNEGCNGFKLKTEVLPCDSSIAGTCTTDSPRDTDWYELSIAAPTTLSVTLQSEFPAQLVLVSGPCEGPLEAHVLVASDPCSVAHFEYNVQPGLWSLVVSPGVLGAPVRRGMPCDLEDPKGFMGEDPPTEPSFFGLRYLIELGCVPDELQGDLNGDGRVSGEDILIVLAWWGSSDEIADIDGSGTVDGADLAIVLAFWTG